MFALLIGFLTAGLVVLAAGPRLGRTAYAVAAAPFVATLVWLAVRRADVAAGLDESVSWVSELGLDLNLRIDGFAALDAGARRRDRRARGRLLLAVLLDAADPVARLARAVRRGDGRAGRGRQPARPLRVLGADVDHVVPADRQPPSRRRRRGRRRSRRCWSPAQVRWRCSPGSSSSGIAAGTYRLSAILDDPPTAR